jgi:eukaryotic-like serine/threonine-protein kinase
MQLVAGRIIAGKYCLGEEIARGGMGAVFAAHNLELGVPVAIKFMDHTELSSDEARARFEREARAAAQLRSAHVVQVFERGIDDGLPFIVMERLVGEDLEARLQREGRLSMAAASSLLNQMAKALRRAQEMGIVHRDLKPSNIYLARVDDDEIVKLLDFGVAKVVASRMPDGIVPPTETGAMMGSPYYMSPEHLRGAKEMDHRSDLWSAAAILFRALTGRIAFQGSTLPDIAVKICADPLPIATAIAPDLPPEVDRFFARGFARDPAHRYQTAADMAADFAAIAAGTAAPSALPPSSRGGAGEPAWPPQAPGADPGAPMAPRARVVRMPYTPRLPDAPPPSKPLFQYGVLILTLMVILFAGWLGIPSIKTRVDEFFDSMGPKPSK